MIKINGCKLHKEALLQHTIQCLPRFTIHDGMTSIN